MGEFLYMKYLRQFGIILFISLLGEALHALLPLPVPASIYGIILLFIGLCTKVIPLSSVEETGKFLIEIMPVMFIPAAVGLINVWSVIKNVWVQYLIVTVASTCIVMGISGVITQLVVRHSKGGKVIIPGSQADDGIVLDDAVYGENGETDNVSSDERLKTTGISDSRDIIGAVKDEEVDS